MRSCNQTTLHDRTAPDRAAAHDLRNLFGIVASAARLLDQSSERARKTEILAALDRVALRGGSLCDALLSKPSGPSPFRTAGFDIAIAAAIPLVRPLVPPRIDLMTDLRAANIPMPLRGEEIETILVELVGNAVRHGERASRLVVRSRSGSGRAWLIVADNGRGRLEQSRTSHHGHGLLRLDDLVRHAGGDLRIRRARCGGMVIGISFPESGGSNSGTPRSTPPLTKENRHENRQSIAA